MHVNGNKFKTFLNFHFGGQKNKYGENFQNINGSFI